MGVPALFRWLIARYPLTLLKVIEENEGEGCSVTELETRDLDVPNPRAIDIASLYVDCNGVVHPCCHPPPHEPQPASEDEMLANLKKHLDRLVTAIKPTSLVYLALDGVAPRAKMNQQRKRRFCAAREAREKADAIAEIRGSPPAATWDHNAITPGTTFMAKVSATLTEWGETLVATKPAVRVVISDSAIPGEGEHKIMAHLRGSSSAQKAGAAVIVGLDADLMFLSLALHEPRLYILRDDNMKLLSIQRLRDCLRAEFAPDDFENFVDDFIVLCFFVGNDFLPQLPCLSINDGGLDLLLLLYRHLRPKLATGPTVHFKQVAKLLDLLAKFEPEILRRKAANAEHHKDSNHNKNELDDETNDELAEQIAVEQKLKALAVSIKADEVNLQMGKKGFRARYYKKVLGTTSFAEAQVTDICKAYAQGIAFVSSYYHRGVSSWSWYFPYHYAPLAADLKHVTHIDTSFELGEPVPPLVQLMCVLPEASSNLAPQPVRRLMTHDGPLKEAYPTSFALDPNGKSLHLTWLWVALLPFVDVDKIKAAFDSVEPHLDQDERDRNQLNHKPVLVAAERVDTTSLPGLAGTVALKQSNLAVSLYMYSEPTKRRTQRRGGGGVKDDMKERLSPAEASRQPKKKSNPRLPVGSDTLEKVLSQYQQPQQHPQTAEPCRFWARGYCARGEACHYTHHPIFVPCYQPYQRPLRPPYAYAQPVIFTPQPIPQPMPVVQAPHFVLSATPPPRQAYHAPPLPPRHILQPRGPRGPRLASRGDKGRPPRASTS